MGVGEEGEGEAGLVRKHLQVCALGSFWAAFLSQLDFFPYTLVCLEGAAASVDTAAMKFLHGRGNLDSYKSISIAVPAVQ